MFCIWEAKKNIGVGIRDEFNTLCWNELATKDPGASLDFYSKLFGWTGKVSPDYTELESGGRPIGGMRTVGPEEMAPPNWMPYFAVSDCNASTESVQSRGGRVYLPPTDLPAVGRFSVVADAQGAVFAMIALAPV